MKRVILLVLVGVFAWQAYAKYKSSHSAHASPPQGIFSSEQSAATSKPVATPSAQFKCDGRTYCSQMTSCAEATYFLKNCPGVKMDGNHDDIPCEKQWCN